MKFITYLSLKRIFLVYYVVLKNIKPRRWSKSTENSRKKEIYIKIKRLKAISLLLIDYIGNKSSALMIEL